MNLQIVRHQAHVAGLLIIVFHCFWFLTYHAWSSELSSSRLSSLSFADLVGLFESRMDIVAIYSIRFYFISALCTLRVKTKWECNYISQLESCPLTRSIAKSITIMNFCQFVFCQISKFPSMQHTQLIVQDKFQYSTILCATTDRWPQCTRWSFHQGFT